MRKEVIGDCESCRMSTPLIALVSVIYLCVAVSLSFDGKQGLALFYAGCAVANAGLIMEAAR